MGRRSVRSVAMLLVGLVAFLFLVATYGTSLPESPFAPVALDGPVVCDSDGELTVVADDQSSRLLILDAANDLTGVVDCTTFDSRIDVVTDVCVVEGKVYAAGVQYFPDSAEIAHERVVAYGSGGEYLGIAYEPEQSISNRNVIRGIFPAEGGVVVGSHTKDTITFAFANLEGTHVVASAMTSETDVFDIAYCEKGGTYVVLSSRGLFDDDGSLPDGDGAFGDRVFTAIDLDADGVLYACDDVSGSICMVRDSGDGGYTVGEFVGGIGYYDVHANNGVVSFNEYNENVVEVRGTGHDRGPFSSVRPSVGFSLRMLAVWASALYLLALLVVGVVRKARRAAAEGRAQRLGPVFASIAVVVALGVAVATLFYDSYQTSVDRRTQEVGMCADYLADQAHTMSEAMERCDDRRALRGDSDQLAKAQENLSDASRTLESVVAAARKNGIGLYYVLYGNDEQGVFYVVDSDREHVMGTSMVLASIEEPLVNAFTAGQDLQTDPYDGTSLRDETRYRLVPIPSVDGRDVAGVVEVGTKVRAFNTLIVDRMAQLLLALLVAMLVVYLSYSEIRACVGSLYEYRQLQGECVRDAVASLARPFALSVTLLTNIDAVMMPLIARLLLWHSGVQQPGILLALPAIMMGVGLVAGQLLYAALGSRVGLRRLMCAGLAVLLPAAALTALSVVAGGFWYYCAAKLVMSVALGLLYALGYSLPRLARADERRVQATDDVERTDVSAAALGTVLGGFAAQALGYEWTYVVVAIACLPLVATMLSLLPKGMRPLERGEDGMRFRTALRSLARNRSMLAIAGLIALPAAIAAGYASFLFPLFSLSLGLEVIDINNIYALGLLLVYVCLGRLVALRERQGARRAAVVALGLLGVVFVLFSLNTTLVWSIVVVFFVALLGKLTDGWETLWLAVACGEGVAPAYATGTMLGFRNVTMVLRTFVLGVLLGVHNAMPVVAIGVVCLACAALFALLSRAALARS